MAKEKISEAKPVINDLIFKELIKRGYSLEGKTRVWNIADSKLWYLTPEQSQAYLDLENSTDYNKASNQKEGDQLIMGNSKEIVDWIGSKQFNMVDLGCGDGKKALQLITKFGPDFKIRYCPIDISGYMVQKAKETFNRMKINAELVNFQYNISDFENLENITPLLNEGNFKHSLFLLLGNTLGNFEVHELLYTIKSAMKDSDVLVIDTAIEDSKVQERADMQAKNEGVNKFLIHIPLQLGLSKSDLEYSARWKNSRIEFFYTINKDKEVVFQNKKLFFNKGDQIIVAVAYKHHKDDLMTYLNLHFSKVQMILSKDKAQALALCKK